MKIKFTGTWDEIEKLDEFLIMNFKDFEMSVTIVSDTQDTTTPGKLHRPTGYYASERFAGSWATEKRCECLCARCRQYCDA